MPSNNRLKVAVVGTGISGLSAAWLLGQRHDVTVYERATRVGGHSNTVSVWVGGRVVVVDTGFIVFNRKTYPNLCALFAYLDVPTQVSDMSFAVSVDDGALEYSGDGIWGLFGQRSNFFKPRFWSMLKDIVRFYRTARQDLEKGDEISLGDYLQKRGYGNEFRDRHLLPMAAAIWSASPAEILNYPATAFIRFHDNHGLLQLTQRPNWETVTGGSRVYVDRLIESFSGRIRTGTGVDRIRRKGGRVAVSDTNGNTEHFDHIVLATHADQALLALEEPSAAERRLLGAFRYSRNRTVLHTDESFLPTRPALWASWNYIGSQGTENASVCVTYWMNRLQKIVSERPVLVTLNPPRSPRFGTELYTEFYEHPILDIRATAAQQNLWELQGVQNTWFCGAYFGAGFHEDGLQAGLAVAEQLGGVRRPWKVPDESGRIVLSSRQIPVPALEMSP